MAVLYNFDDIGLSRAISIFFDHPTEKSLKSMMDS